MQQNVQGSEGNSLLGLFSQITSQQSPQGFQSLQSADGNHSFESLLHQKMSQYTGGFEGEIDLNQLLEVLPAAMNAVSEMPSQALFKGDAAFTGLNLQSLTSSGEDAESINLALLQAGGKTFPPGQQVLQMGAEKLVVASNAQTDQQAIATNGNTSITPNPNAVLDPLAKAALPQQSVVTGTAETSPNVNATGAPAIVVSAQKNSNLIAAVVNSPVTTAINISAQNGQVNGVPDSPVVSEQVVKNQNNVSQTQEQLTFRKHQEEGIFARQIQVQRQMANQTLPVQQAQQIGLQNVSPTTTNAADSRPFDVNAQSQQSLAPSAPVVNQDARQAVVTDRAAANTTLGQQNASASQSIIAQSGSESNVPIKTISDLTNELSAVVEQQSMKLPVEKMPNLATLGDRHLQPNVAIQVTGEESDIPEFLKFDTSREMSEGQLAKTDLSSQIKEPAGLQMNTVKSAVQPTVNNVTTEVTDISADRESLTETSPLKSNTDKPQASSLPVPINHRGWGDAFSSRVQWLASNNVNTAEIRLDPAHLGKIEVQIDLSGSEAKLIFNAENAQAREALESALPRLKEMMSDSGFQQLDVDVDGQERKGEEKQAAGDAQSETAEQALETADTNPSSDDAEQALASVQQDILGVDSDSSVDFYA